ncbi:helix-turn-helix transcriptional regulator [Companilactobacillus mishanensis]|uniref:YafY family transcriptional regulator n=1 Tax=Companilactobacillus mishanensis TaxID=2486008 RepID=A0A5P0ZK53_9LACO|nr:YafY family protein [Companilactobacillus mishanensis]MQS53463.1 YafY family transcriptional regulator [Companilactobacillus mishanensis]
MNKSERLNQELIFLSNKNSFHINDLTDEFQISKRTALRDISELETMGLSLYVENGRYGGYRLIKKELLVPVIFNLEEVSAIFFAIKALTLLSSTPFEKNYQHIYDKLLSTLPTSQQDYIEKLQEGVSYYRVPSISASNFLKIILDSIVDEKIINITYKAEENPVRQIQVFNLLYRNGIWFCDAYDINRKQWNTYRCDRIKACQISNEISDTYSRIQLKNFQIEYEKTYHDIPFQCELTELGEELFQKNNYPNMRLKREDGKILMYGGYNREEFDYMVEYLISLGKNVKINYPKELQQAYLDELKEIIKSY